MIIIGSLCTEDTRNTFAQPGCGEDPMNSEAEEEEEADGEEGDEAAIEGLCYKDYQCAVS